MKFTSLKARFSVTIIFVYLLIGLATYLAFDQVTGRVAASLGTNFASKQALLEKSKMLSTIQRDLSLSQQMAASPFTSSQKDQCYESDRRLSRCQSADQ